MFYPLVSEFLAANNLRNPYLRFLRPDERLYDVLAFQPAGTVSASPNGVRRADHASAMSQFKSYLALAQQENVDLVVSPEYSCPWEALGESLASGVCPSTEKLWVLGCEGLPYQDLVTIQTQFADFAKVLIPAEADLIGNGSFVDPVCFVFSTESDVDGANVLVVLVQLKTALSGDPNHFERDHLKTGRDIYIFKNTRANEQSIKLATLICSDSLPYFHDQESIEHISDRSLLVHIQLNTSPTNQYYRHYRERCFGSPDNQTEIFALNWASNVTVAENGHSSDWNNDSRSTWYIKSNEVATADARIADNHKCGLYLTYNKQIKLFSYLLNYHSLVFHLRATKPWQHHAVGPVARRTGPEAVSTYAWDPAGDSWQQRSADSGFPACTGEFLGNFASLANLADNPLDAERLISLCAGKVVPSPRWTDVTELEPCKISSDEIVHRTTFTQDKSAGATQYRAGLFRRFGELENLVSTLPQYPVEIADLHGAAQLRFDSANPSRNLWANQGRPATVAYLGEEEPHAGLTRVRQILEEMLVRAGEDKHRLVIWYRSLGHLNEYRPIHRPSVSDFPNESPTDISKGAA